MDLISADIKKLYREFLVASVVGALATSIYTFVDAIAVGQAVGPDGSAAMACINPFYGIMVFLSILCGMGGSVLMSNAKGNGDEEKGNAYFTVSILLICGFIVITWIAFALFHKQIFTFFGADASLMPKVMEYARWLIYTLPVFVLPPFLSAFIRNDGAPNLAMAAVLIGGSINIFGDWFFVFPLRMGMKGAAIATVLGAVIQAVIMGSYFFRRQCNLRLVKPFQTLRKFSDILGIGIGASIFDFGSVFLAILTNNQIMRYSNSTALAVYGAVITISSLLQVVLCGVGQAIQPIVSANFGAKQTDRVKIVWKMAFATVLVMGLIFTGIGELFPKQIVQLFMDATPDVIAMAPSVIRPYFVLFPFLGVTVLSTYHLQATMHGKMSMIVAALRSVIISGLLLLVLPCYMGVLGVWLALPCSELVTAIVALCYIKRRM